MDITDLMRLRVDPAGRPFFSVLCCAILSLMMMLGMICFGPCRTQFHVVIHIKNVLSDV